MHPWEELVRLPAWKAMPPAAKKTAYGIGTP